MLFIIEYYEFNNATSFEATEVLQIMQIALDDEDIESIKQFVMRNLQDSKTTHYHFPSGKHTNHGNLAAIIKIGLGLKRVLNGGAPPSPAHQDKESNHFHMLDEEE